MTPGDHEFPTAGDEFADALATLEERGSNFLVVGAGSSDAHDRVSRQLFGTDTPSRRRLLVLLARNDDELERRLGVSPTAATPGTLRVVRHSMLARSAAATQTTPEPFARQVESETLTELGRTIAQGVLEFIQTTSHREPGWLRLGFDALLPLFGQYEREPIFRFLRTITHRIRDVSGMGHFHLAVPVDDPLVDSLRPLFDGIIRTRVRDGHCQQRWYLTDADASSAWQPL